MLDNRTTGCWFLTPTTPTCFVQLGRFGDIMLLLPAFREIAQQTGTNPVLIACSQFASVLDGVSYVTPIVLNIDWLEVRKAKLVAAARGYTRVIIPKWWDDPGGIKPEYRGDFALNYQGKRCLVDVAKFPNYMTSQWECCGFSPSDIFALPLVFDRRSPIREAQLFKQVCPKPDLPLVVYNFNGVTSPFGYVPEVLNTLRPKFARRCRFVDMGNIRAHRIFDLLGIMDAAKAIITCDTATLHLATASTTTHASFIADGWGGSVPRGNCGFYCRYGETPRKIPELVNWLEATLNA